MGLRPEGQQMSQPLPDALGNAELGKQPHQGSHSSQDKSSLTLMGPRLIPGMEEAQKGQGGVPVLLYLAQRGDKY